MSSKQQTLDGDLAPEAYLDQTASENEQEYRCTDCDFRVTRSPTRPIEYGHSVECEHWIGRGAFADVGGAAGGGDR